MGDPVTDIYRDALRKLESLDPKVSVRCAGCLEVKHIPAQASFSMCDCGRVLKEPKP